MFNRSEFFWVRLLSVFKDPALDPMDWRLVGRVETAIKQGKPYKRGDIVHFKAKYVWRVHPWAPVPSDFDANGYRGVEHRNQRAR